MARVSPRDLETRYSNSVLGRKADDEVLPFMVSTFTEEERGKIYVHGYFAAKTKWSTTLKSFEWKPKEWVLDSPKLGLFNIDGVAVHLKRSPRRQYKRAYSVKNITKVDPLDKEYRYTRRKSIRPDNIGLLKEIFNPNYPSPQEAIEKINSFCYLSIAFNSTFGFGLKRGSAYPVVIYKDNVVGVLIEDEVELFKEYEHLREQLSQYVTCRR